MRKETAAEKELCGRNLQFTGSYYVRGDLVEEIGKERICDLVIFFFFLSLLRRNDSHPLYLVFHREQNLRS